MSLGSHVVPRVSRFPGYPSQPECPKMFLNALRKRLYVAKIGSECSHAHINRFLGCLWVPRVSRFPGYPSQSECPKMFLNALKASIFCKNKF